MNMKDVRGMAVSKVSLPREVVSWLDNFLIDIVERNAHNGNLHGMLREAYVLGAHHAQIGAEALGGKK